jgi:hypothetical protein
MSICMIIREVMAILFDTLKLHRINLLLPVILMKGLYLLIFIINFILIFNLDIYSIIIINGICLLFLIDKAYLASVDTLFFTQRNLESI